ncbi:MAG: hypothetical protein GX308_02270 [Epulopiscium sp.]|nr:hypothetical protein [Candidatus Epulonipiscium sp.]
MIIKLIGSICLVSGTAFIGFFLDRLEVYRMMDLQAIKKALIFLRGEIDYMITPLPLAMEQVSSLIDPRIGEIFAHTGESMKNKIGCSAKKLWEDAIEFNINNTYLTKSDKNILLSLGDALGYLDKEMQKNNIELILLYLGDEMKKLEIHHQKNGRLYKSLGILGGLLIAILLY